MEKRVLEVGRRKEKMIMEIKNQTNDMFVQLEKMIDMTVILFENNDTDVAIQIIEEDLYLDQLHKDLIVEINYFIIREQPKATDLRLALGTYSLSSDIERIGDYLKGFAKLQFKEVDYNDAQKEVIYKIFKALKQQIQETSVAYKKVNHQLAKAISNNDQGIGEMYKELVQLIAQEMVKTKNSDEMNDNIRLNNRARSLVRANDHIINMCEQVSFIANGQIYHYS